MLFWFDVNVSDCYFLRRKDETYILTAEPLGTVRTIVKAAPPESDRHHLLPECRTVGVARVSEFTRARSIRHDKPVHETD